jgi:thymidylate synthase
MSKLIDHPRGNIYALLALYRAVASGHEITPRGQKVRNVRNMLVELDARWPILTSFKARNFNLKYAKVEWLWYLGADKFDDSIEQHATMWKKLKQPTGEYYSNYGQYMFGVRYHELTQFEFVANTLLQDPDSRRASMVLLKHEHMFDGNSDMVCTYGINFCIEDGKLHMTVMMRSNDVIFGFTNDAFAFQQLYSFMYTVLKSKMPHLETGTYTHMANSMHVYERHFQMINLICAEGVDGYQHIEVPAVTYDEVVHLVRNSGAVKPEMGAYSEWLAS